MNSKFHEDLKINSDYGATTRGIFLWVRISGRGSKRCEVKQENFKRMFNKTKVIMINRYQC